MSRWCPTRLSYRFRTSRYRTCRSSQCRSSACPRLTFPPPQHSTSPRNPLTNPWRCCRRPFQSSRSRTQPPSLACLRSTTRCSRCQNSTYPTQHAHICAPKVDVPKFEVPAMPKFDMPATPPAAYSLNVPKFYVPMKSSSPAAVVTDKNLEPQEVCGTLHMSVIEMGCSLKWFTVSTKV